MERSGTVEHVETWCALCVSRCGAIATIDGGRFVALDPNPAHPTGKALCIKGKVAPELVDHPDRLLYPLERTRPKGDPDPGWQRISWDEALDTTAARLKDLAARHGPEATVFAMASPSTSATSDVMGWVTRLRRAYGSPNLVVSMELCGWGRYLANAYTFGAPVPGAFVPDLEHAGCILFWGYNPTLSRLAHATATVDAMHRGAKLVVVDPRRVGLARRADHWLRPRPGTDGALALALIDVAIERGWYDAAFVREWTNAPLLVRDDTGEMVTDGERLVAWDEAAGRPALYDPSTGRFDVASDRLALFGPRDVETAAGRVTCRPVFDRLAALCRTIGGAVEDLCGVDPASVEAAARTLWEARPVAYYAWSGVEQQTGATQIARAIATLYALTGNFDDRGGNVAFASVRTNNVEGAEFLSKEQRAKALGLEQRPLGGARWEFVTTADLYRAILDRQPYAVRGLVTFGANLVMAQADSARGRDALAALDFCVHADLFMNPTAEMADIVLPVTSPFESEALRVGFEVSAEAQSLVQLRPAVAAPRGEARSDTAIVFDLACRLGLGAQFWDGDVDAAWRHHLAPSGVTLEELRAHRGGRRVPVETRYRKYALPKGDGVVGFDTPSRKVELYSPTFLRHGQPALPEYEEPLVSPRSRPDLHARFPLVLTTAKSTYFCETQHRALPSLRRKARDPEVEIHPQAAAARSIRPGDWVRITTPHGSVRARAALNDSLDPGVVCGQHGWWQACPAIGAPGYDPYSPDGANLNLVVDARAVDPVSGSVPLRAWLCEIERAPGES